MKSILFTILLFLMLDLSAEARHVKALNVHHRHTVEKVDSLAVQDTENKTDVKSSASKKSSQTSKAVNGLTPKEWRAYERKQKRALKAIQKGQPKTTGCPNRKFLGIW
jgi:hypothetical protein